MNGRAYDYNLGRFLSVDPIIQSPGNSQSLNPYSYIMNNPLAGTDPSGYAASCDIGKGGDCGAVASSLGKGETADITQKQSVTGSRIQATVKVGSMTGNGNGTVTVQTGFGRFTADIGAQQERSNIESSDISGQPLRNNLDSSNSFDGNTEGLDPELVQRNRELTASCAAQSLSGSCNGKTITPEMADNFSNIVAGTLGAVSVGEAVVIAAEQAAIRVAVKSATNGGVLEGANFAQRTFGKNFSAAGKFAGQSVDDVAAAIRSGALKVSDVPIDYIVRNGNKLILNTRSSQALIKAGIPRSQWNAVNRTGNAAFEARLTGQLNRNNLTEEGISTVRQSGGF